LQPTAFGVWILGDSGFISILALQSPFRQNQRRLNRGPLAGFSFSN